MQVIETRTGLSIMRPLPNGAFELDPDPTVEDIPGSKPPLYLRITNTTPVAHEFRLDLVGLALDEELLPPPFTLEPDAEHFATIELEIPNTLASGCHALAIKATSLTDEDLAWYAAFELKVADGRKARIQTAQTAIRLRRKATTEILMSNLAETPLRFSITGGDPEEAIEIEFAHDGSLEVPPARANEKDDGVERDRRLIDGQATLSANLKACKRRMYGDPIPHVIDVTADAAGASHSATIRIEQRAYIAPWFARLVWTLGLLILGIWLALVLLRIFIFDNPTPQWRELESPLSGRTDHTATWVEFEEVNAPESSPLANVVRFVKQGVLGGDDVIEAMIVWGGSNETGALGDGALYSIETDLWLELTDRDAPSPRLGHTAVWSNTRMIIWGGRCSLGPRCPPDRAGDRPPLFPTATSAYSPSEHRWQPVTASPIRGRYQHGAVWTDKGMFVWGGRDQDAFFGDGGLYCDQLDKCGPEDGEALPVASSWTEVPAAAGNAPSARAGHVMVWTGDEVVVWGGYNERGPLRDGAIFNPETGKWRAMKVPWFFEKRAFADAAWTDTEMVVIDGVGAGEVRAVLESRQSILNEPDTASASDEEVARRSGLTLTEVQQTNFLIEAGFRATEKGRVRRTSNAAAFFDPATGEWRSAEGAPPKTPDAAVVWTIDRLRLVFGVPTVDTIGSISWVPGEPWERLPLPDSDQDVDSRAGHSVVWTRGGLIVFGGRSTSECVSNTGCYPANGAYLPIAER